MKSLLAVTVSAMLLILCSVSFGQSLRGARAPDPLQERAGLKAARQTDLPDRGADLRKSRQRGQAGGRPTSLEFPGECPGGRATGTGSGNPAGTRPPAARNLRVLRHDVSVRIVDGVAITEIDQTFHNNARMAVEGTFDFPLPDGAVVEAFSIYERGREIHGVVMGREEARRIYDRIPRRRKDPGIVEVGRRGIQTRIFPIPAGGDMRVKTRFAHVLGRRNGESRTRIPLEGLPGGRIQAASFSVDAVSSWPLALRFPRGLEFRGRSSSDSRLWDMRFAAEDFAPRRNLEIRCRTHLPEPGLALHVHRTKTGERFFMAVLAAGEESLKGVELSLEGVVTADVYPKKLRAPGRNRLAHVFGRIVGTGAPVAVLRARVGREPIELKATPASAGDTKFVAGIWAVSRVEDILGRRGGSRLEKEAEAVELSRRLGILTERTAILAR